MAWPPVALYYDVLGGTNLNHTDRAAQTQELLELVTGSENLIPDPAGELVTRPGFSKAFATAIAGSLKITGLHYMKDLADELIVTCGNGTFKRGNANPPGALTGGTAFTSGDNVLTRSTIFNDFLIAVSNARDLPQTVNASAVRADLGGTPARGMDVKAFARRVCMFSPIYSGTTYRSLMAFTSANDNQAAWTAPVTVNFLNFGRTGTDVNLLGGEVFADHLMAFTEDGVFPVYATPNALLPLAFQQSAFTEAGGGPPNIQAVVSANDHLYWISKNFDVKVMDRAGRVTSAKYADAVRPFLRGLNDSRRIYTVGGWDPIYRMVLWAVSDGSDTQNNTVLALHLDTGWFFLHTISRNAFCNRTVSGEPRLLGGGYSGFLYNEYDASTTGNLDDSTAAISARAVLPRLHAGQPDVTKKIPYCLVEVDPIGTETITVDGNLDDNTGFTDVSTTLAVTGTDTKLFRVAIPAPWKRFQPRFTDAVSGERMRIIRLGFPRPIATTVSI